MIEPKPQYLSTTHKFPIIEVFAAQFRLDECASAFLKGSHSLFNTSFVLLVEPLLLKLLLDFALDRLEITLKPQTRVIEEVNVNRNVYLEMGKVRLLVKGGGLEAERMNNVVDGLGTIFDTFLGLLRGRVGTYNRTSAADLHFLEGKRTNIDLSVLDGDHRAIDLVNNIIGKLSGGQVVLFERRSGLG